MVQGNWFRMATRWPIQPEVQYFGRIGGAARMLPTPPPQPAPARSGRFAVFVIVAVVTVVGFAVIGGVKWWMMDPTKPRKLSTMEEILWVSGAALVMFSAITISYLASSPILRPKPDQPRSLALPILSGVPIVIALAQVMLVLAASRESRREKLRTIRAFGLTSTGTGLAVALLVVLLMPKDYDTKA